MKKTHSPDLNWENWDQTDLEYEDEKVLEKRRQLLQRELELQMKREKEEQQRQKKDKKIKKVPVYQHVPVVFPAMDLLQNTSSSYEIDLVLLSLLTLCEHV